MCYSESFIKLKEPTRQEINFSFNMFKMRFSRCSKCSKTRATCWINSKITNRENSATRKIFLCCYKCWSLRPVIIICNYWSSLMLWNSTSWSSLKLPGQIQLVLHHYGSFFINDRNMNVNNFEKDCFVVLDVKLQVKIILKMLNLL